MSHTITNEQARRFILLKQGLLGDYQFQGKEGALAFVRQAGCLQFDPIDPHGRNAEIVLQSRVDGFSKQMLWDLLYKDRKLIDYWDKCMSIFPVEDWPYFDRTRKHFELTKKSNDQIRPVEEEIKRIIREKGPVNSKDVGFQEKVDWWWAPTRLARAALEQLYFKGELVLHHKKGVIRHYDLTEHLIPQEIIRAENPNKTDEQHFEWNTLRRIGAVGLLWNKPSDAWIALRDFKAPIRNASFNNLIGKGLLKEVAVEGLQETFYYLAADHSIMEQVEQGITADPRTELIAPLDSFIWDRKQIKALFDFDYTWEIYKKPAQRQYGYYVMPVLHGTQLIGRTEIIRDKQTKQLIVKNFWREPSVKITKEMRSSFRECIQRFAKFNEIEKIKYEARM